MAVNVEPCPNGECHKNEGGVRVTALDEFGHRVLGLLRELTRVPETVDPWVHFVIGERPTPCSCDTLHVLASLNAVIEPGAICLVGDADVLAAALAPIVKLTVGRGKICIDLADLRAVFLGRAVVTTLSGTGATLETAAATAMLAARTRLEQAQSVLLHIDAPNATGLFDVNELASRVQEAAPDDADVVFNFYGNGTTAGEVDSVRVTVMMA